jgi:hypothetical protein
VLMQGVYQATLVREPRGVVVIEGPESDAKSRAVLAQAGRLFPGQPVLWVVSTSPLWMHIGGLREYARRRVPIYALDANASLVRQLLAAPHRLSPDSAPMPLHPLVYWPAKRLLYASDLVIPPAFEPTFTAAYEADVRRVLGRLEVPVSTVFALHLPPFPWPPRTDTAQVGAR